MAHLDLLSRSRRGVRVHRLISIVPLPPLDQPFNRLASATGCSSLPIAGSRSARETPAARTGVRPSFREFVSRRTARASFSNVSTILSPPRNRLLRATRRARCHHIGSKGRGGDVCIHRPAVFRSNKSSRRVSPSFPRSVGPPPLAARRYPTLLCPFLDYPLYSTVFPRFTICLRQGFSSAGKRVRDSTLGEDRGINRFRVASRSIRRIYVRTRGAKIRGG